MACDVQDRHAHECQHVLTMYTLCEQDNDQGDSKRVETLSSFDAIVEDWLRSLSKRRW